MTPLLRRLLTILVVIILLLVVWVLLHQIWVDENCTQIVGTTVCK